MICMVLRTGAVTSFGIWLAMPNITKRNCVGVWVLPDVNVTLYDGVEGGLIDAVCLYRRAEILQNHTLLMMVTWLLSSS